jgi:hypothetical protein
MKQKPLILVVCFLACAILKCVLIARVPFDNLKAKIPESIDSTVRSIYEYYHLIANREYESAFSFLSPIATRSYSLSEFESNYTPRAGLVIETPEKLLRVVFEIRGDGAEVKKYDGRLVMGVRRRLDGDQSLVSVEWSNSFVDLWINDEEGYVVVPDVFSRMREMDFEITYGSLTAYGSTTHIHR